MRRDHANIKTDEGKENIFRNVVMLNMLFVLEWRPGVKQAQSAMPTDRTRKASTAAGPV
jgi:hypothetical protein